MPMPQISVVIPTLNEADALPATLEQVLSEPQLHECIVVDGGSSDTTVAIAEAQAQTDSRVQLLRSPTGRGKQMNAGAKAATGDLLLFHHADTQLPPKALQELSNCCSDPEVRWGGFQHSFSQPNWKLQCVSWMHNYRFRRSGVVFGDQSMFARRDLFDQVGGFSEQPLEDLIFSDAALLITPSHALSSYVVTESRKFVQMGELRAFAHVVNIIARYELKRSFASERFFKPYR